MKQPFQLFMLAIMIAFNIGCKKEKNQSKTIQLENLKWSKVNDGLSFNLIAVGNELFLSTQNQVLKSTDMGTSWIKLGWPAGLSIYGGLAYSPKNNQLIISAANNGWYYSTDKGLSFKQSGPTGFNTGSADILPLSNGQIIGAQTGNNVKGLYKSAGITPLIWSQKMGGVDFTSITKVTDDTLYACGVGAPAIVKSVDGGENWTAVETKSHALDYILSFQDSILVVHRWGTISVANRKSNIDLYAVRSSIAGNMAHFADYSSTDKLLIISASENGIYLSLDMAISFKFNSIPGVKTYIHPKIIGDYLFVNTDAGLYRAQFKF